MRAEVVNVTRRGVSVSFLADDQSQPDGAKLRYVLDLEFYKRVTFEVRPACVALRCVASLHSVKLMTSLNCAERQLGDVDVEHQAADSQGTY
jgi:hypothetical protein